MLALYPGYCMFAVYHEKNVIPAFFKVSIQEPINQLLVYIDHLFVNLESRKIKYCFGKSLEFWIQ